MSIRATFHYFQGMECDMYSFYRIPKLLFTSEYFKNLSCEAKVLYGLMLDRMSLSINRSMGKLCLHKWSRAVCSKSGMNTSSMCFSVLTGVQAK